MVDLLHLHLGLFQLALAALQLFLRLGKALLCGGLGGLIVRAALAQLCLGALQLCAAALQFAAAV